MSKTLHIALREFVATVGTKGFLLGILMTPILLLIVMIAFPLLINQKPPKIDGEVAILDPTGVLVESVREYLSPAAIAERRGELEEKIENETPEAVRELTADSQVARRALDAALGEVPTLRVVELPESSDVEAEKVSLHETVPDGGGRLALVIVGDTAVQKTDPDGEFGTYEMFIRGKLDQRIISEIRNGVRSAIVDARIAATGLDRERIEELTHVARVRPIMVTEAGETKIYEDLQVLIPMGFMILLLVSVFTGGQYLMTSTIEEKSSRVVEILLSAVSPMQLMAGKIFGQMVVGMLIIGLYAGMGISALVRFALLGLLEWHLLLYLILFYLISYFVVGSLMAAIGAAVNEPREAQSFMMPIMLIMMVPWMLWFPISRDPNSLFATIASFTPPINTFVMLMRMSSTTPPPWWQVWVSILIGVASVYAALWFAAKVFRVGLLLHGKPPSFRTLLRWVRQS